MKIAKQIQTEEMQSISVFFVFLCGLLLLAKPTYAAERHKIVVRYTITTTNSHKLKPTAHTVASGAGGRTGAKTSPSPTRTASQQTVPPSASHGLSGRGEVLAGNVEQLIRSRFGDDADVAVAIARCESGLRPDAVGDHAIAYVQDGAEYGKSYGPFQIRHLPGRPSPDRLLDPSFNIEYAYNLFKRSSWYPWSAYKNGCYKHFLSKS